MKTEAFVEDNLPQPTEFPVNSHVRQIWSTNWKFKFVKDTKNVFYCCEIQPELRDSCVAGKRLPGGCRRSSKESRQLKDFSLNIFFFRNDSEKKHETNTIRNRSPVSQKYLTINLFQDRNGRICLSWSYRVPGNYSLLILYMRLLARSPPRK